MQFVGYNKISLIGKQNKENKPTHNDRLLCNSKRIWF